MSTSIVMTAVVTAELSTTQIYTQVSIRRLKAVHALTHPSAKIDRPEVDGENPDASGQCAAADAIDEADDTTAIARPALTPEDAKTALFATLATEAESDDAIDDDGEADGRGDGASPQPATTQPPTAP